jgi:hypothetical protein
VAGRTAAFFERRRAELAGVVAQGGGGSGHVAGSPAAAQLGGPAAPVGMSLDVIGLHFLLDRASAQSGGGEACAGGGALQAPPPVLALPAPGDDSRPEEAAREQEAYLRGERYVPVPVQQQAASALRGAHGIGAAPAASLRRMDPLQRFLGDGELHMSSMPAGGSTVKEPLLSFPRMQAAEMTVPAMGAPAWAARHTHAQREPAAERVPMLVDAAALSDDAMMCTPPDAPRWPPDPVAEAEKAFDASVEALIQEDGDGAAGGEQAPLKAPAAGDGPAALLPMQPHVAAFQEAAASRRRQLRLSEDYTRHAGRRDIAGAPRAARDLLLSLYSSDDDDVDMGLRLGGPRSPCVMPMTGSGQLHGARGDDKLLGDVEAFSPNGSPSAMSAEEAHAMVTTLTELLSGEHSGPAPVLGLIAGRTSSGELPTVAVPTAVDAAAVTAPPPDAGAHDADDTMPAAAPTAEGPGERCPEAGAAPQPAIATAAQAPVATPVRVSRRQTRGQRMVALAEQAVQTQQQASAAVEADNDSDLEVGMLGSYALQLRVVCACLSSDGAV